MPATVDPGDLLIVILGQLAEAATVTTPSGWTAFHSTQTGGVGRLSVYHKSASGSEDGGTVDFVTSSATTAAAQVYRITGWSAIEAATPATLSPGSTTPNPPSFNPSGWGTEDTLWIAYFGGANDDNIVTAYPANYTNGIDTISGAGSDAGCEIGSARRENAAASEDPGPFTINGGEDWVAGTIAVRPAAGETFEFTGSETVSFDGTVSMVQSATFADSQTVSFDGTAAMIQTAAMTGAEEVGFDGTADTIRNQWAFDGSEDVSFDGTAALRQDAAFTGAETVSFDGSAALKQSSALTGSETVSFDGTAALDVAAIAFEGQGVLSFDGSIATLNMILEMEAAASVSFDGQAALGQQALFEGAATLSFDGVAVLTGFQWDPVETPASTTWSDVD